MPSLRTVLYLLAGGLALLLAYDWWRRSREREIAVGGSPMMELGDAIRDMHNERGDDDA